MLDWCSEAAAGANVTEGLCCRILAQTLIRYAKVETQSSQIKVESYDIYYVMMLQTCTA